MEPDKMDPEMERSILFTQLLCPPLPLVGRNQLSERITNSHDLMFAMFGRLLALPSEIGLKDCFPESGFNGNWKLHILKGKHATDLLESLISQSDWDVSRLYPLFCNYCREVIRILVGYDMASQVSTHMAQTMARSAYNGAGDIRFLADPNRISFSMYPGLVNQIIDNHLSIMLFWTPETTEQVVDSMKKHLVAKKDYYYTLTKSMHLMRECAKGILEAENELKSKI